MRSVLALALIALAATAASRPVATALTPATHAPPVAGTTQPPAFGAVQDAGAAEQTASGGLPAAAGAVEVDHVYLWVRPGAPEAAALRGLGLRVMNQPAHHTGNGTSSVGVLFENRYLELLYPDSAVSDSSLTAAERADRRRRLRWRESGASPVGIGLRRLAGAPDSLPFPTEARTQPWLRPGTALRFVTTAADSLAPAVFVVPPYLAMPGWMDEARRDTAFAAWWRHSLGARRVTRVRVVVARATGIPPQLRRLDDAGVVRIETGAGPLLELTLDGGGRSAVKDLRPELPLVIRY